MKTCLFTTFLILYTLPSFGQRIFEGMKDNDTLITEYEDFLKLDYETTRKQPRSDYKKAIKKYYQSSVCRQTNLNFLGFKLREYFHEVN